MQQVSDIKASGIVSFSFGLVCDYTDIKWILNSVLIYSKRETEQRMELMMENSEIVDALHQLGNLLHEENRLSERLDEQASSHR